MIRTLAIIGVLIRDLRFLGNLEVYQQILEGKYNPLQELNIHTKELIKDLKKPGHFLNT